ncbi:MAG: hypothetical protein WCF84_19055 [Anaerolineae bacterium]
MADKQHGPADEPQLAEPQVPPSRLTVEFTYPGSAEFKVETVNVSPMQIMALAGYLEFQAHYMMEQSRQNLTRIAKPELIVPGLIH